ncbi:RagB/SusD family nutrient uptake outer membrane protein [Arachidicoccus terrestris]|uniref:RagB/SusD family nutrient uptake outer membrane protein n=1 Tax=Arachidicoccus terrestris TaxID=2875539 RepID=UPI001CC6080C|nr:RagB/SusD family nutrient uptake outer membrane protein [Arachidicoccus terrestris]UAY55705.1 RagB/SusD family nutrient uptake outer membrane protein [Arachidicoccus terrestris]
MKNKFIYFTAAVVLLITGSCKKFLEVQPEDKYLESQVFGNENAIQQALNGVYQNLASNALYGEALTNTDIEVMGQRFNTASQLSFQDYQTYNYTDVATEFERIWTAFYNNILQANQFVEKIDGAAQKGIISRQHAAELKGEAIGLRAFMHFDLLRIFGPVMKVAPTGEAIPYYTKADAKGQPILNATQVIDSVLTDLNKAKTLLSADPVITEGVDTASHNYYRGNRAQRFNYYAVIALEARVQLYKGDNGAAHAAAKEALTAIDKWFPWMPYTDILNNANPNRIFSPEVLFGIYNQNMYINYQTYFSPTLQNYTVLNALPGRLSAVFENNTNDYRYTTTWVAGGAGPELYFYKFADLTDQSKPWRFLQPLIRKSELYYILAETDPDPDHQRYYLNTVRNNRGLTNLVAGADMPAEIQKAYQKEFWGEGQLFFYYKRKALTTVPSGNSLGTIAPAYVVPLPVSETSPR